MNYLENDKMFCDKYSSKYIDVEDFKNFLERLEKQLILRLTK